jgi:hypothetical protein
MSCSAAGRGHRRSWSWPGTASRTCCAGSVTSGTDPGMPGCPGSSPPEIRSGTATTSSACAPIRYGAWKARTRTRGYRAACSAATGRSARGPRPRRSPQAPAIPGTSPARDNPTGRRPRRSRVLWPNAGLGAACWRNPPGSPLPAHQAGRAEIRAVPGRPGGRARHMVTRSLQVHVSDISFLPRFSCWPPVLRLTEFETICNHSTAESHQTRRPALRR